MEDGEIIAMVKNGNADSFAEIIERYGCFALRRASQTTEDYCAHPRRETRLWEGS